MEIPSGAQQNLTFFFFLFSLLLEKTGRRHLILLTGLSWGLFINPTLVKSQEIFGSDWNLVEYLPIPGKGPDPVLDQACSDRSALFVVTAIDNYFGNYNYRLIRKKHHLNAK